MSPGGWDEYAGKNLLRRNRHEQSVRTQTMKIIQTMQFQEDSPLQGLSEAKRGSAVFANIPADTDPPRGRPVGSGGFIANK